MVNLNLTEHNDIPTSLDLGWIPVPQRFVNVPRPSFVEAEQNGGLVTQVADYASLVPRLILPFIQGRAERVWYHAASADVFNMSALVQYHQIIFCGVESKWCLTIHDTKCFLSKE